MLDYSIFEPGGILRVSPSGALTVADFTGLARFADAYLDGHDTIGGLLMQEFGRLPRRGETIQVGELEFRVLRADRRRIDLLRVTTPVDIEHEG